MSIPRHFDLRRYRTHAAAARDVAGMGSIGAMQVYRPPTKPQKGSKCRASSTCVIQNLETTGKSENETSGAGEST